MQVITSLDGPVWPGDRSVVTIGAYDGLHRGHRAVIGQVVDHARKRGCRSAVVTFDRHPASVVRPESAPRLLTTLDRRLELFEQTGVDAVIVLSFDSAAATEEPEDFVRRVFIDALGVCAVVVGEDFHFGRDRRGNVALLTEVGRLNDFVVLPIELQRAEGDGVISSTAIRKAIGIGDIGLAATMLGRPVEVIGEVIGGDQRGRTIGFPTANIDVGEGHIVPADGVYAAVCVRPDGSEHACAVNVGRRPTFYAVADRSLVEAHLLDFDGDLYGERLSLRLVRRLRDERRFDGLDALVAQLGDDIAETRRATEVVGEPEPS
jgi:riboflavin kinase/FMN adenylyltransferase